jgi:hexosaminidase
MSWCVGYPAACTLDVDLDEEPKCWKSLGEPLNPASNLTFMIAQALIEECAGTPSAIARVGVWGSNRGEEETSPVAGAGWIEGMFPDEMLHVGGDEVRIGCWNSTPAIRRWLEANGMNASDGYGFFVKRLASMVVAQRRRPVQWVEVRNSTFVGALLKMHF